MRIGYAPYDDTFRRPGDRRRFVRYAQYRDLTFEIADPRQKYDLVVLSELADISTWADYPHGKLVFDLIDAYLSIPRTDPRQLLRGGFFYLKGRHQRLRDYLSNLRAMCRRSDAVVCSTGEQAALIGQHCHNVRIILDIHDMVATRVKTDYSGDGRKLVWEGLPSNLPQLKVLPESIRRRVRVYTAPEWNEAEAARFITGYDIAVIPIDLTDRFVSGKPENKLLMLWRMGMPVIASATPAYKRCMEAIGASMFSCATADDWNLALEAMRCENNRARVGVMGFQYAKQFGAEQMLERWDQLFLSLGFDFRRADNETVVVERRYLDWIDLGGALRPGRSTAETGAVVAGSDIDTRRRQ